MTDATKVGVLLATRGLVMRAQREGRPADAGIFLELAERAEAEEIDSVWVGDSLVSKPRLEPVAALAAIAARTTRIRLGTAVMLPAVRHPVPLAHSLATVDVLSRGRLTIGAGVGGAFTAEQAQDWTAAGVEPSARASRLTEMAQVMKRLWTEDDVSFAGRHFRLEGVTLYPKPVQPGGVPLLLAVHHRTGSEAQYRRAARYADGIIGITDGPDEFAEASRRVMMLAAEEGRDASAMERVFYMTVHIDDDPNAALAGADDFLIAYYGVRHWGDRWGPWGGAAEVAARMRAYADAGAQHLIVRFAAWDQRTQFERFVRDVLPLFRAG